MVEIKVNDIVACDADKSDVGYFVIAYKNIFPNANIYTNDNAVDWFYNTNRFVTHVQKRFDKVWCFDIVKDKYVLLLNPSKKNRKNSNTFN